jgi:NAD dependent epimerase/dehydratase family enzyme
LVRRPAFLPVPALALKAALGEFASDILASQNVVPEKLSGAGFTWSDPTIEQALAAGTETQ